MGPSAIRYAGLRRGIEALGHLVKDLGDLDVPLSDNLDPGDPKLKYLDPIVAIARKLSDMVATVMAGGSIPIVLGGDHSLALGSVVGATSGGRRVGLIWLDTHGDFNTHETTPSGNIHGMPLAALCGIGDEALVTLGGSVGSEPKVSPSNIAIVGARDLDAGERDLLRKAGVSVFSMTTIDRRGIGAVMEEAIKIASEGTDGIYVSLDLDVVDPAYAPGVGTPAPGGLTFREAHLALEMVAATDKLLGMDVVEVNPILDRFNRTAELAVQFILSGLGKVVWEDEPLLDQDL